MNCPPACSFEINEMGNNEFSWSGYCKQSNNRLTLIVCIIVKVNLCENFHKNNKMKHIPISSENPISYHYLGIVLMQFFKVWFFEDYVHPSALLQIRLFVFYIC